MSLTEDRQEIADLLDQVDDVHGFPYRSPTMRDGDAWPLISVMDNELAGAFQVTWNIVVVLPKGEVAAADWFAGHWNGIVSALEEQGFGVTRIQFASIETEAGDREGALFTAQREA